MILFINGDLGLRILKFIHKKNKLLIKKLVLIRNDDSKLNLFAKQKFSKKILYWNKTSSNLIIKELRKSDIKLIFLIWWPKILKKKFLNSKKIFLNTHPSYLPFFKGKDPNFWGLLNNGPYGVCIHHVNEKIDSGPIAFRSKIKGVDWTWDAKKLYKESINELFRLFKKNFKNIINLNIPKIAQPKKNSLINFRKDMLNLSKIKLSNKIKIKDFLNLLRAKNFPPHEGVHFFDIDNKYSINIKIKKIP